MKISSLTIKGLYGYLDKHIDFNADINLLVGINGSGKTSVLNLIHWMLIPSLDELCLTQFVSVELRINYENQAYSLRCERQKRTILYHVEPIDSHAGEKEVSGKPSGSIKNKKPQKQFHSLRARIEHEHTREAYPVGSTRRWEALQEYAGLNPDPTEENTWSFLTSLPKPLVVGLDRELVQQKSVAQYEEGGVETQKTNIKDSASLAFKTYQNKIIELNSRLKDLIMLAAFERPEHVLPPVTLPQQPTITAAQVREWQDRVNNYLKSATPSPLLGNILESARVYFSDMLDWIRDYKTSVITDPEGSRTTYILQTIQFQKTKKMIENFEEYESSSEKAYAAIKSYLEAVNHFFKDSDKELFFKKNSAELCFRILSDPKPRDIESLSSGEKQLVILFTQLCFNKGKIFIIDEPELSLHPKWQQELLPAFIKLVPPETQLVMATHSASIVGKNVKYCKTLLPYNQ